jgi:hypothetical protein
MEKTCQVLPGVVVFGMRVRIGLLNTEELLLDETEPAAGSGIIGIKHIPESVGGFEQQVIPDDLFSDEIKIALSHPATV